MPPSTNISAGHLSITASKALIYLHRHMFQTRLLPEPIAQVASLIGT